MYLHHIGVFIVEGSSDFLVGLSGKGGSAIATPMVHLIGLPGIVAIAAPLPAMVPGTYIASVGY